MTRHAALLPDLPAVGLRLRRRVPADGVGQHAAAQRGDGTFEDTTWKASANPLGWFWGSSFADFDNDGWHDIYSANGWVYNDPDTEIELEFLNNVVSRAGRTRPGIFFDPKYFGKRSWHGWERNRHLRNNGDGTFSEIGRAGRDRPAAQQPRRRGGGLLESRRARHRGRGVDRQARAAEERRRHQSPLARRRAGRARRRTATRSARASTSGRRRKPQMREVVLGDGYGSQNTLRQYFGLGDADAGRRTASCSGRSRGRRRRSRNVAADRIIQITEGTRPALVEKHYVDERLTARRSGGAAR